MDASQAARSSTPISSAWSRYGLSVRQRSAVSDGTGPHHEGPLVGERVMEIQSPLLPVALNRALRKLAHGCDLREREPAEELQFHHLHDIRLNGGDCVEEVAKLQPARGFGYAVLMVGPERGDVYLASALVRAATPEVVDDQAPHHPGRVGHEPGAIREDRSLVPGDLEVGF